MVHLTVLGSYHIFYQEGGRLFVGGPEFFGIVKGGAVFFSGSKGGPEFFEGHRGRTRIFSQDGNLKCKGVFFQGGDQNFFSYAKDQSVVKQYPAPLLVPYMAIPDQETLLTLLLLLGGFPTAINNIVDRLWSGVHCHAERVRWRPCSDQTLINQYIPLL